jgi:prepilin-type N-terminal cleavage/methylation domain-containing protein
MRLERILRLQQRRDDGGFSLVELSVAIAVFSIVITVIFGTVLNVMSASNTMQERTAEQAETRLAIDTLMRELRQAYQTPGTASVLTMTATQIVFYSPDRDTDFHLRKLTYNMAGGVLTRTVDTTTNRLLAVTGGVAWAFPNTPTSSVVLTGITNATLFTYKDQNNAVATTGATLRSIVIDFVIDRTPNAPPAAQPYHTQVDLRVT